MSLGHSFRRRSRRWCTKPSGARPFPLRLRRDGNRGRPAQLEHSFQHMAPDQRLRLLRLHFPGSEFTTEYRLEPEEVVLDTALLQYPDSRCQPSRPISSITRRASSRCAHVGGFDPEESEGTARQLGGITNFTSAHSGLVNRPIDRPAVVGAFGGELIDGRVGIFDEIDRGDCVIGFATGQNTGTIRPLSSTPTWSFRQLRCFLPFSRELHSPAPKIFKPVESTIR